MTFHRRLLESLSATPPSYDSLILAMSPSAYWRLDEAPGATTFADATGNGNTLTGSGSYLPGSTPITPNQSAKSSVDFLGTGNALTTNAFQGRAALASGATWDSSTGVSISFVGTLDMNSGLFFPFGKASASNGFYFQVNGTQLQFVCAGQGYIATVGYRTGPLHLAVSLNYTATTNAVSIWIDGVLNVMNRTGGTTGLSQPSTPFFIGGRGDGFTTKGRMQACAFWFGTALSDAQVQALYLVHNRADRTVPPIPFVYDNDMGTTDNEDAAATAITVLMAMRGVIKVIAAIATASDDYASPAVRTQLNYYGFTSAPVGAFQGAGIPVSGSPPSPAQKIRNQFAPTDVRANYTDPATLYQSVLTAAANASVVVYIGGSLGSVAAFLNASTANKTLWNAKVKAVIVSGGQWPNVLSSATPPGNFSTSGEYNLATLPQASADFISYSTTPAVYWSGVEICGNVGNSPALADLINVSSPSYWNNTVNPISYPSGFSRTAWDHLALHQGLEFVLRGAANTYYTGNAMATPTISNTTGVNSLNAGTSVHQYLTPKLGPLTLAQWRTRMALMLSDEFPPNTNTYT